MSKSLSANKYYETITNGNDTLPSALYSTTDVNVISGKYNDTVVKGDKSLFLSDTYIMDYDPTIILGIDKTRTKITISSKLIPTIKSHSSNKYEPSDLYKVCSTKDEIIRSIRNNQVCIFNTKSTDEVVKSMIKDNSSSSLVTSGKKSDLWPEKLMNMTFIEFDYILMSQLSSYRKSVYINLTTDLKNKLRIGSKIDKLKEDK